MVIASDNKGIIQEDWSSSLVLTRLVIPWVSPKLEIINKSFGGIKTKVIHKYNRFTVVTIPPPGLLLDVALWIICPSLTSLTSSWRAVIPKTPFRESARRYYLVVLFNSLELKITPSPNVSRYLLKFTLLSKGPNRFPVSTITTLTRLDSKLPRSFDTSFVLHTVVMGTIVNLNNLKMSLRTMLLQSSQTLGVSKV